MIYHIGLSSGLGVVKSCAMNQRETMLLIGFIAFYLPAFGLIT
jgi:hypothetical protein